MLPVIPFHVAVHGERVLLLKAKDALCVHFSLDRLNAATKSPLCLCVKASICVSLHFCHRMCTKCWLTAFWVTAPPPFPQERFVARLIYPLWHTGISFPAMSISGFIRRETGARIGAPFELVVLQSLASRRGNIKFWGERGKKAAVCVLWKCWRDIWPIAYPSVRRCLFIKPSQPCSCVSKAKTAFVLLPLLMGRWGSQQCTVNYMVFVWRAGLIQVRAWMCVYSWADWSRKFCSISIASYCSFIVLLVFIIELWKSCKWIEFGDEGHEGLSSYTLVLTAHVYMYISLISRMRIFQEYSSSLKSTVVPVQKTWFLPWSVAMFFPLFNFLIFVLVVVCCVCVCYLMIWLWFLIVNSFDLYFTKNDYTIIFIQYTYYDHGTCAKACYYYDYCPKCIFNFVQIYVQKPGSNKVHYQKTYSFWNWYVFLYKLTFWNWSS